MKKHKKIIVGFSLILLIFISFFMGNQYALFNYKNAMLSNHGSQIYEKYNKLGILQDIIDKHFLFKENIKKIEEDVYKGLFKGLDDPYSEYLTKDEYDSLMSQTEGGYSGIGLVVTPTEDGLITVVSTIKDTPAEKAGIQTGDKIIEINNKVFRAENLSDAVLEMKGKPNTDVSLKIRRENNEKQEVLEKKLKRQNIVLNTVNHTVYKNVGYLQITQFGNNTAKEFDQAFDDLKSKNVKGVVLDLRNNPGGTLDSTVKIADRLLPKGPIIKMINKEGKETVENSNASEENIPIVVLVNGGTASASEVLSGALRDYNKATIIGEKTFGKGIVQQIFPLNDGTAVKLTISEYYTPKGNKINKKGIKPDITLVLNKDVKIIGSEDFKKDNQFQKAIELLQK